MPPYSIMPTLAPEALVNVKRVTGWPSTAPNSEVSSERMFSGSVSAGVQAQASSVAATITAKDMRGCLNRIVGLLQLSSVI